MGAVLLWAAMATAQGDTLRLTVEELLRMGMENNLKLKADTMEVQMAKDRRRSAAAGRSPELTVSARAGYMGQPIVFEQGLTGPTYPDAPDWMQDYAVDFTQPIFHGGKIHYAVKRATIAQTIAELQAESDGDALKLGLMQHYLDLFSLYKQRDVLTRSIAESERRLEDIKRMKREGLITNNDVLRSELQLTNDRLQLDETENSIALVSHQIDVLLGLDEGLLIAPDTTLLARSYVTGSYEEYLQQAYDGNPDIKMLAKETEMAEADVKIERAGYMPDIDLYAGDALARPITRTMEDRFSNTWNVGVNISYPLSSLYKNRDGVSEKKRNVLLRKNMEEQYKQEVRVGIRSAYIRHSEAVKQVEALRLSVKQAEENYRIMQNRYLSQLTTLTDLLDAENVRLEAELLLTTAQTRVIYTYYELQKACGNI